MSYFRQARDQIGNVVDNTPNSEMLTAPKIRLVGTIFDGSTLDTNFWTKSEATATVTQVNSQLLVTSGTASPHAASVYTGRRARWVTGSTNKFRTQVRFGDGGGTANVTWRLGVGYGATMPTITDGAYFSLSGTVLSVNTMSGGVISAVNSGGFNGVLGTTYTVGANITTYEILYTFSKVYFIIGGSLLHTVSTTTAHWTQNVTFHVFAGVVNTGASAAVIVYFRMMNIARLGGLETATIYKNITGTTTPQILKYGAGRLHSLIIGTPVNNKTVAIYDNTTGTINPMMLLTLPNSSTPIMLEINTGFYNGLNVVPNDNGLNITVVYE